MVKIRLFAAVLVCVTLLVSCSASPITYLSSLDEAAEYSVRIMYGSTELCGTLSVDGRVDGSIRNVELLVDTPTELAGVKIYRESGEWQAELLEMRTSLGELYEHSPVVRALLLLDPGAVKGATLGGSYNEISTAQATYYTDQTGLVREIRADGITLVLDRTENVP